MEAAGVDATGRVPLARIATTLFAAAVFVMGQHVPVPGIDPRASRIAGSLLSIGTVAVAPIIWGFILVEIFAALVPRWRRLRSAEGRAVLDGVAIQLAVAISLFQAVAFVRYLETVRMGRESVLQAHGAELWTVLLPTLVAGTCLTLVLATVIDRRGVGRGISVLIAAWFLDITVRNVPWLVRQYGDVQEALEALAPPVVIAVGGAVLLLTSRWPIRLPSSGLDPVHYAANAAILAVVTRHLTLGARFAGLNLPRDLGNTIARIALTIVLCVILTYWYQRRAPEERRAATRGAVVRTSIYLVIFGGCMTWPSAGIELNLAFFVTVAAVALDLFAEIRFRTRHGELSPALRCETVDEADDAVAALQEKGIPAFVCASYHRALLHFFGPFVRIEVLVPAARAGEQFRPTEGQSWTPND